MAKYDVIAFINYLKTKWGATKVCPMCGNTKWNVLESTYEIRDWDPRAVLAAGQVLPVVPVVCTNCGNTVLVSAVAAGVGAKP
jgi:predicted RNA-binding Zn-ribbon protein involved in translation (DUF1610 family)